MLPHTARVPAPRAATRLHFPAVLAAAGRRCARGSRGGLAAGALLGGLCLAPGAAGAQRGAPAVGGATSSMSMRTAADSLEEQAAARVADAVCGKRVVLLGQLPEHGHARGFGVKARIVERLVARCGFRAVLFEAGSFDFFGVERAIATPRRAPASAGRTDSLDVALARAIGGFWWTRELAGWRRWLLREAVAGRLALGGLDDQPSATAAYARATLPGLMRAALPPARVAECQGAITRYFTWSYTEALPYDSTEQVRLADCSRQAADRATAARTRGGRRTLDDLMLRDLANHFARERGAAGTPDRDLAMAQRLAWWAARLPRDARMVVWTASVHAARAPGPNPALGVPPMGAHLAATWGDRLAVIGFTALQGHWSRAAEPARTLAPLPPDALEARALAGGSGWAYLDRAALRSLGPVPSRLFGRVTTTDWSAEFDGVVVIRDEAPPAFEARR